MTDDLEYVIESPKNRFIDWKELWSYRELFYLFTWRDVKVKYKQAVLGIVWVILQPILSTLIFSLFFGRALNVRSAEIPYPVFVFSGLLLWTVFSSSINTAGNSMLTNAGIIKKIYFPRIIIPVSSILVSLVDFSIAFVMFLILLLYYQVQIDFVQLIILWPLAVILMLFGTLGMCCWLAALTVKYRDFRYVIPFGLQIALFISPVIYPLSIAGNGWIRYILALNPICAPILLFRMPLIGLSVGMDELLISCASAFLFMIWGIYYFKRTEAYFADIA